MPPSPTPMTVGDIARWACVLEVCAPKAGNVHPGASFADTTWRDFLVSADVCAPILNMAAIRGVGRCVLDCVYATNHAVGRNTNLGMLLLLAPLCAVPGVPRDLPLREGVKGVLARLTQNDASLVFEAIRAASPGGLGDLDDHDVRGDMKLSFADAMALASRWDAVARQHSTGYADVFDFIVPSLATAVGKGPLDQVIVYAHLAQIAREPDSLIARKCGHEVAEESMRLARQVLAQGWPALPAGREAFAALDAWLRADGNRRNPGTSADLVAAALFVLLRQGTIAPPFAWVDELLAAR